jgi:hypothetical protein
MWTGLETEMLKGESENAYWRSLPDHQNQIVKSYIFAWEIMFSQLLVTGKKELAVCFGKKR